MCVIALTGFVVVASQGEVGGIIFVTIWAGFFLYYGLHVARLAVVCDANGLTVRNRFRTRRLSWSDIRWVGFGERARPPLQWGMKDRASGLLRLTDKTEVFLDATESFRYRFYGSAFSMKRSQAEDSVARIRSIWESRRPPGP
jgi:hypothetical protein